MGKGAPAVTDRLQKWTALLVAAASIIGALSTWMGSEQKQQNDYEVVKILAEQLSEARQGCK